MFFIDYCNQDNSYLYLFSALLQANAAILSLLAVFSIFKIRSLEGTIGLLRDRIIRRQHNDSDVMKFETMTMENKSEELKKVYENCLEDINKNKATVAVKSCFDKHRWVNCLSNIKKIKTFTAVNSIILAISIIIFASIIKFSSFIITHGCLFKFEILSIVIESICMLSVVFTIIYTLSIKNLETYNIKKLRRDFNYSKE